MKKTVAAIAILASSNAMALIGPFGGRGEMPKFKKVCLESYDREDGSKELGCDATHNNQRAQVKLMANGCAEDQVALTILESQESPTASCMPPGMVQL